MTRHGYAPSGQKCVARPDVKILNTSTGYSNHASDNVGVWVVVQAAQEHANHAGVLLGQTRQLADDIRSQVAESRELVFCC